MKLSVETRRPGRRRSEQAHRAILAATAELLVELGVQALRIEQIARRAGVSKATIYRWWPSKEVLALDALAHEWEAAIPSSGWESVALRDDLLQRMGTLARMLHERPLGRVAEGLAAHAQSDDEFASVYYERYFAPRREIGRRIFRLAIERGEIPPETNVDLALDLLYGALTHRYQNRHAPLDDDFLGEAIDVVIAGLKNVRPAETEG